MDDGNGGSDTNILLAVDAANDYIYGVSIPRDSKAVFNGKNHKINAAYNTGGMEMLADVVSRQLGIPVDYTVLVDLRGFEALVNAIGGVDFYIPVDMDYDDPDQNLFIHLRAGEQHLTGEQLMWVVRFRSGYANADIGRTEVQRAVLKAAMKQWLRPQTLAALPGLWRIYKENLTTDLSARNLLWMARVLLKGMGGDIEANVLPGYATMVGDASVYMIDTYAAAPLLADYSPYK